MRSKFQQYLKQHFSFLEEKKLLLATSGGLDSMVMAHLFYSLNYQIALAHVNFQLRGDDSDADEQFVKKWAKQMNIDCFVKQVDAKYYAVKQRISIQMSARDIRYQWFDKLIKEYHFDYLLTAHHLDDSIETFIINLNRRSGLDGLTGITSSSHKIVRPLIHFKRQDIKHYAEKNHLNWREDRTNQSIKYERNHIRHKLIPKWETINPNIKSDLQASMSFLKDAQILIQDYLVFIKPQFWEEQNGEVHINLRNLLNLPHYTALLYQCLKIYGFTDWEAIDRLLTFPQSGKKISSKAYILLKNRDKLLLYKNIQQEDIPKIDEGQFVINECHYTIKCLQDPSLIDFSLPNTEYFDYSKIKEPLKLRHWKEGDYFYPLGLVGKKKLSDFFTDKKMSLKQKSEVLLLCDGNDNILWIIGCRMDNRFKITANTTQYLKITWQ